VPGLRRAGERPGSPQIARPAEKRASGASAWELARTRSSMRAQAGEQLAKLASIVRQIEQKQAEAQPITANIAKIDPSLHVIEEEAAVRHKAMQIESGNRIACLDAQTPNPARTWSRPT
jgi:hemolysin D